MRTGLSQPFWTVADWTRRSALRLLASEGIEGFRGKIDCRQEQADVCSCLGPNADTAQLYGAVDLTNDHATGPQSQTCPPRAFRAEEGLKEAFGILAADAMSVISNTDSDSA